MIKNCPHCQGNLNLSVIQVAKVQEALAKLPDRKFLKIKCPHCKKTMELAANGELAVTGRSEQKHPALKQRKLDLKPPAPPPLDWLASGKLVDEEAVINDREVLILMADGPGRSSVVDAFKEIDYTPVFPESAQGGIERMRFTNYSAVVLHSRFDGNSLAESIFHDHMRKLTMTRRRSIFYTLIGPEFKTLYNLEALVNSANLVINDKEVNKIRFILKKAIPEYEELFGSYVDTLIEHGQTGGLIWLDVRRKRSASVKVKSDVLKDLLFDK
jgi:phage FluMu protein Com